MEKLNNKGFAISSMLYSMLILVVTLMFLVLGIMNSRRTTLNKMIKSTEEDIYKREYTFGEVDITKAYEWGATTVKDFSYDEDKEVEVIVLGPGRYQLEVWGAQGGTYNKTYSSGGKGGYSKGVLTLTENTALFINVGGKGETETNSSYNMVENGGGRNGGGNAGYRGGGGGGATDIRLTQDNLYARVIVAGGGGGSYYYSTSYRASGGAGGGTVGEAGNKAYTANTYINYVGKPGVQTSGGEGGTSSGNYSGQDGTFGQGGNTGYKYNSTSYYSAGAGGGGWYGGGGAALYAYRGTTNSRRAGAGGGGGSGWIYTSSTYNTWRNAVSSTEVSKWLLDPKYYLADASTISGSEQLPKIDGSGTEEGHSGDGYARITKLN